MPTFAATVSAQGAALERLARIGSVSPDGGAEGARSGVGAHAVLKNGAELFLPLEGVIDVDRESARLRAEIERLRGQLQGTERKLANDAFVSKAPAEVVERERDKAATLAEQASKLEDKLRALEGAS